MTRHLLLAGLALGAALSPAPALVIDVDYTYAGDFFATNPAARAALERAAADVQNAITSTFAAVPGDSFDGHFGSTEVTIDWAYSFANPSDASSTVTVDDFALLPDRYTLYVGAAALPVALGVGGGVGVSAGFSIAGFGSQFSNALANAVALSNAGLSRGAGPSISLEDSIVFDGVTANYALQVGRLAGVLTMNSSSNWHFALDTAPAADQSDFYSVALHEILHTLGFGTSQTWDDQVVGFDWTGAHAIAAAGGSGTNLISEGGSHIAEGAMSVSIVTGLAQEAVMDPTLTVGTTKTLTALDLAFLQDIGYTTVAVPEPATVALLGLAALAWCARRRRG